MGRGGGGQVVSVLTFYTDNPSLNSGEGYIFFVNLFLKRTKKATSGQVLTFF